MCRKMVVLISFVLMLGSISIAEDIKWTDLGADHLWSTPENWDLGRIPTLADDVLIDAPAAAEPNGPVIQDGIAAECNGIWTEAPGEPSLTITGGSLVVAEWIWWGDGADSFGIWNMSGGTVDVTDEFELGWGGGAGTLTLTGGTINAGEAVIPTSGTDGGAFGELFLYGGTYNVTKPGGLEVNENGLIDITKGALVLEGNETAKINDLIAAGQITAYGGDGQFDLDFDARNPGKTTLTAIEGVVFLFDNFESYADDAGLTAAGWTILDTPEVTETGTTWTITNPGGRANPATLDGSASTGKFLISDSDKGGGENPTDSGASHDVITPSFSTAGADKVWLHMDLTAQLNNNGAAIFDVDVSIDGGGTWTSAFSRVAPGRVSGEGAATTRLPDNTNTDGYYGQLDVDLTPYAADQNDVQLRIRHFEPNDDWYIALDNLRVDNNAAPQGGSTTVFSEDFSGGLGQMNAVSGQGNTGTETWHTTDKGGRYVPGTVQEQGVNRLGPHPNEHPEFAIIDSDANPDPAEDEWLMTPSLDLSGLAEVFLHYDSETVMSSGVWNQEVLVSLDGGSTFEATPIFAYTGGGLFDNGEEPAFAERIFDVSGIAAGESQVVFAFRYAGDGDDWWWAIDNVEVSGVPRERFAFLSDDFESYADDAELTAAGWTILDTAEAIEGSTWTITNPAGRPNPATLDGSASTGKFLISDSDQQSESNPVDSGASHDVSTPSFSTLGYTTVWLHADVSAQLNNNGAAIFDVEVSTDGGGTWTNVFSRVAPGRVSAEGATTRLPDNTNTDGYYGRLDVDLSAVAPNEPDVQVRFRHFEPNWDWWIAIDNILIDDVAAPQGGPLTVFSEDFSNGLGQMNAVSGQGNTGTETWHTTDKGGRYVPGTVQEQGVNRLGPHPNEHPEFAIIDSDANPDPAEDEWLMTPSLDLSGLAEVFLHYDSETVMSSGVSNQEVLVSLDGGSTFEATPIFAYTGGGLFDNGEEPVYAERIFDVSSIAAGESQVVFAFRYAGDGDNWWWAVDNVKVSGVASAVD